MHTFCSQFRDFPLKKPSKVYCRRCVWFIEVIKMSLEDRVKELERLEKLFTDGLKLVWKRTKDEELKRELGRVIEDIEGR